MLSGNKEPKEKKEVKATPVTIEFKNPSSSADPMEIAINHHGRFPVSDASHLLITKRMELKFEPSLSSIKRNLFLNHVYQGELEEARVMLQSYPHTKAGADKLKILLTTPAEIRNFLGRTLSQTPLQTALRTGDASVEEMIKSFLKIKDQKDQYLISDCEEIIKQEEAEYKQYLAEQQKIICNNDEKIGKHKHERDLDAYNKVLHAIKEAKSVDELDVGLNSFRKYLYEADQRGEAFNEKLLLQAMDDFYNYYKSLDWDWNFRTQKFFRELIGAIEAIAPPINQKAFAQEHGVYGIVAEEPARPINRKAKVQFCPWNSTGVLDSSFTGAGGYRLGVNSSCDYYGPVWGDDCGSQGRPMRLGFSSFFSNKKLHTWGERGNSSSQLSDNRFILARV